MSVSDTFGNATIVLLIIGLIAFIMRIGQDIEAVYPGSVVLKWVWLGTWGTALISCMIIWIFDLGYRHGKRSLEKEREREQKSWMESKT